MSEVSLHFGSFPHALPRGSALTRVRVLFPRISVHIVAYLFDEIRVEVNAVEWVEPKVRAFRCER